MTYQDKLAVLRAFSDLQAEMAAKAKHYAAADTLELAMRFSRASYAAVNARMFMHAALMAERELKAATGILETEKAA
jgi:hypothetical protein